MLMMLVVVVLLFIHLDKHLDKLKQQIVDLGQITTVQMGRLNQQIDTIREQNDAWDCFLRELWNSRLNLRLIMHPQDRGIDLSRLLDSSKWKWEMGVDAASTGSSDAA